MVPVAVTMTMTSDSDNDRVAMTVSQFPRVLAGQVVPMAVAVQNDRGDSDSVLDTRAGW